ncbi:hypothetical protein Fmac_024933 [Flemingia macrophylla]|uniref:Uncharacterized protein n=1 Tax=Flemingia macrophylla TaxID=520843 RepID=A0ABD1LQS3_9FABA
MVTFGTMSSRGLRPEEEESHAHDRSAIGRVEREECATWTHENRLEEEESRFQRHCHRHCALPLGLWIYPKPRRVAVSTVRGRFDGFVGLAIRNSNVLVFTGGYGGGNNEEVQRVCALTLMKLVLSSALSVLLVMILLKELFRPKIILGILICIVDFTSSEDWLRLKILYRPETLLRPMTTLLCSEMIIRPDYTFCPDFVFRLDIYFNQ